jgi:hypothetical protein
MEIQLIISATAFVAVAGGFYYSTKTRLDKIEIDLSSYKNSSTEIVDRLARIETKLDFVTKK